MSNEEQRNQKKSGEQSKEIAARDVMNSGVMNKDWQLDSLIKQMAANHPAPSASAGLIWWRAQILKKLEQKELIERPMVIMRMLATTLAVGVLIAALVANSKLGASITQEGGILLVLIVAVAVVSVAVIFLRSVRVSRT